MQLVLVFLSCKANARVKLAKTGHGPHSATLVVICVVLFIVCVYMCTVLLPPGGYPIAVNKYIMLKSITFRKLNLLPSSGEKAEKPPTPLDKNEIQRLRLVLPRESNESAICQLFT